MRWLLLLLVLPFWASATFMGFLAEPWAPWRLSGTTSAAIVGTPQPVATLRQAGLTPIPGVSSWADQAIAVAMTWLGVPYLFGGCTVHGVDCSCAVRNWLAAVGIRAPRTTTEQIAWATPVPRDQAQPGDLVFFDSTCSDCGPNPTHVGMVIGSGRMIDAGDPVKVEAIFSGHNARYGRPH